MRKRNSSKKVLILVAFALFATGSMRGQATIDASEWIRIVSPSGELSIDVLEKDMLVDIEGSSFRVHSFRNGFSIYVSMTKNSNAKNELRVQKSFVPEPDRYKFFQAGDFLILQSLDTSGERPSAEVSLASSRWSYQISVRARESTKTEFANTLDSIQIGAKPLFKASASVPPPKTIRIDALDVSPSIVQALAQPDSEQIDFPRDVPAGDPQKKDEAIYSRPLLTLRRPRAPYTDAARSRNVQGVVKLRIPFLANGRLGEIGVVSSVDSSLEKNVLKVAKQIKFVPAQIDGKSVDVVRTLEYTFTIY